MVGISMKKELWIGMIEIEAIRNTLIQEGKKGFVNLILLATGKEDFNAQAVNYFKQYDIEIIGFNDIAPFEDRMKRDKLHKSLVAISKKVLKDEIPRFGNFYSYEND
jgi:hypothetical protein